jgi:acyl-CoA synthetase (AMP-forming)/AMP-acid ligase II
MTFEFKVGSNIADQLSRHAIHRPTKIAIIQGQEEVDYLCLFERVIDKAKALLDIGIKEGDIVGVALSDNIDHIVMLFAIARAGAIVLPMDCRWSATEKEALCEHFKPSAVLVEEDSNWKPYHALWVKSLKSITPVHELKSFEFPSGKYGFTLSLSSGTTGRPKGPLVSHQQFINRFLTHWIDLGFGSRETYINATPLYFGGGRAFSLSSIFTGGTVVLFAPPYSPFELGEEIKRTRATILFLVPTLLRRILSEIAKFNENKSTELQTEIKDVSINFKDLKTLISSGSALTSQERQAISQNICNQFIEYYSSTEGGGVSVLSPLDQEKFPDSVGRPIFGVDVQIVDEAHNVLPSNSVGRIRYKSSAVADGFYNDPESSLESFKGGWFYPGDLGLMNEEGYLFLKGRFKDMIIRGGVNIYPLEIENTLMKNQCVAEAAVISIPSNEFGEEVAAVVRLKSAIKEQDLIDYCKQHLAPYKVPKLIRIVEQLPTNSGGKVLKSELAKTINF